VVLCWGSGWRQQRVHGGRAGGQRPSEIIRPAGADCVLCRGGHRRIGSNLGALTPRAAGRTGRHLRRMVRCCYSRRNAGLPAGWRAVLPGNLKACLSNEFVPLRLSLAAHFRIP
jgi:hypothetical protein